MLLQILKKTIENQRVLLLGFGREGRAVYKRIMQVGGYAALGIADQNEIPDAPDNVKLHIGDNYQSAMPAYDIVFKSPGIVLKQKPEALPCRVTSLTELFLTAYRDQCIGITGTKGKSSRSSSSAFPTSNFLPLSSLMLAPFLTVHVKSTSFLSTSPS